MLPAMQQVRQPHTFQRLDFGCSAYHTSTPSVSHISRISSSFRPVPTIGPSVETVAAGAVAAAEAEFATLTFPSAPDQSHMAKIAKSIHPVNVTVVIG